MCDTVGNAAGSVFQEKAAELLEAYRSSSFSGRSLLSFQELSSLCSSVCPEESSLCLALLQLQRDKRCTVSLHEGDKVSRYTEIYIQYIYNIYTIYIQYI